mgnify:CR=1 FL=1
MLERSGGLVWDKGWKATGKGSALAKQFQDLTSRIGSFEGKTLDKIVGFIVR